MARGVSTCNKGTSDWRDNTTICRNFCYIYLKEDMVVRRRPELLRGLNCLVLESDRVGKRDWQNLVVVFFAVAEFVSGASILLLVHFPPCFSSSAFDTPQSLISKLTCSISVYFLHSLGGFPTSAH